MKWLMHESFPITKGAKPSSHMQLLLCKSRALAGHWHVVAPTESCMVCPFVQDTKQQLQATQQQLEAELQELAAQVSAAEMKLAAEPAKQRALALQVLAITHASTQANSKYHNLWFSMLCLLALF